MLLLLLKILSYRDGSTVRRITFAGYTVRTFY